MAADSPGGFLATQTLFSDPYRSNSRSSSGLDPPDPKSPMYTRPGSRSRDIFGKTTRLPITSAAKTRLIVLLRMRVEY